MAASHTGEWNCLTFSGILWENYSLAASIVCIGYARCKINVVSHKNCFTHTHKKKVS